MEFIGLANVYVMSLQGPAWGTSEVGQCNEIIQQLEKGHEERAGIEIVEQPPGITQFSDLQNLYNRSFFNSLWWWSVP